MKSYLSVAIVLCVCGGASLAWSGEPISVTLCEISAAPEMYDGQLIRVHARVESDGLERTVLVDPMPKCRYGGASFDVAPDVKDPAIEKISDTIFSGASFGTRNKFIRGDFVGVFHVEAGIPRFLHLEVQSVSNLKITLYGSMRK